MNSNFWFSWFCLTNSLHSSLKFICYICFSPDFNNYFSKPVLSDMEATSHMRLFKLRKIKQNKKFDFSVTHFRCSRAYPNQTAKCRLFLPSQKVFLDSFVLKQTVKETQTYNCSSLVTSLGVFNPGMRQGGEMDRALEWLCLDPNPGATSSHAETTASANLLVRAPNFSPTK